MKLLFIVLNKEEYLEPVLELFVESGVRGATVLDSVGMGRILAHDIPIFAGLRNLMPESRPFNKTIFTVIEDEKILPLISAIEEVMGSLDEPGTGLAFTVPVDFVRGLAPALE